MGAKAVQRQTQLNVKQTAISELLAHPQNARDHSKYQIRQIAKSIQVFGFNNPVLIDRKSRIIAGHARVEAAELVGMTHVPTITLDQLTEDQARAYMIADNRLAECAKWNKAMLTIEFQHLLTIDDFDITVIGFEVPEIDLILKDQETADIEEEVELPANGQRAISQIGDLWLLGKHRIFCGDSLSDASYQILMGTKLAAAIVTDPPYNVRIDGHATGNGAIQHREFAMASGEMTDAEFRAFLKACVSLLVRYSAPQSVHYLCMDWRHIQALLAVGAEAYTDLLNLCVWVKNNAGLGSFYRSSHELIAVFRNGKKTHRNNVQLGKFGRNRTNVWQYPGVQTQAKQGDEGNLLALHPTVKPIAMIADAILDCTARGEIVLDAFLGSGTTLMATERVDRICYGIEIDPLYVDVAVQRWQKYTGESAIHAATGKSFDEIAQSKEVSND
jgi:DNA modification methylase